MTQERDVGGLKCSEVLAHLSEFVDGELDQATLALVGLHLAGCTNCEQFGGKFAKMVGEFRRQLGVPQPAPVSVQDALYEVLGLSDGRG
jgi:anti-sigma factor RsiW